MDLCCASKKDRLVRGAQMRNLYLQGDPSGDPQTYMASFQYIDNLSAYLFSPEELRFILEFYGFTNPVMKAMGQTSTSELHKQLRRGGAYPKISEATTWSLVKGKTFIKLLWANGGFEPTLIQPEMMGVLREDLSSLDEQDAFCHTTYVTEGRFREMLQNHPDKDKLIEKATKYMSASQGDDSPERMNQLKQVILGGLNPYQTAGHGQPKGRGQVDWLGGPYPTLAPALLAKLVPIHELWVWDEDRGEGEYTTIQFVGEDCIIAGKDRHRNIFADPIDYQNKQKNLAPAEENPLAGKHPFIEFCPNPLDGYFWGRPELTNVALLQKSINKRIDGINKILRMQENPPRVFSGGQGITSQMYSKANNPGGYMTDASPNAKITTLAPELPPDIWADLHELERMFNEMGGFTPVMKGHGESGVRTQGQAESLIATSSPRFKKRALTIEQQVESLGGLAFAMLQAHVPTVFEAWVEDKKAGIWSKFIPANWLEQPAIPGMKPIPFLLSNIPDNAKIMVDSHSSSPAFSHEVRGLMFDLFKAGTITPEQLVMHTHPPGQDSIIEELRGKAIQQEAFAAAHPELAAEQEKKSKKKH